MSSARCANCRVPLHVNPRAIQVKDGKRVVTQRYCGRVKCQRRRKREAARDWRRDNAGWQMKQRGWMRAWSDGHPDVWKKHRAKHPEYRERERLRMQRKRAERVAKVAGILRDPVGYLRGIRSMARESVAKVDGMAAQLDGLVDYLEVRECVAKADAIDSAGAVG